VSPTLDRTLTADRQTVVGPISDQPTSSLQQRDSRLQAYGLSSLAHYLMQATMENWQPLCLLHRIVARILQAYGSSTGTSSLTCCIFASWQAYTILPTKHTWATVPKHLPYGPCSTFYIDLHGRPMVPAHDFECTAHKIVYQVLYITAPTYWQHTLPGPQGYPAYNFECTTERIVYCMLPYLAACVTRPMVDLYTQHTILNARLTKS